MFSVYHFLRTIVSRYLQMTSRWWFSLLLAMQNSLLMQQSWFHRKCSCISRHLSLMPKSRLIPTTSYCILLLTVCRYCDAVDLNCGCPQRYVHCVVFCDEYVYVSMCTYLIPLTTIHKYTCVCVCVCVCGPFEAVFLHIPMSLVL